MLTRKCERYVSAGNRSRTRASVCLQNIAINRDRAFATARKLLPISRCISCVRPDGPPRPISLDVRVCVARGNIEYSAVNHPCPEFRKKGGTRSSSEAEHTTRVLPISINTEPSA